MNQKLSDELYSLCSNKGVADLSLLYMLLVDAELAVRRRFSSDIASMSRLQGEGDVYAKLASIVKRHLDAVGIRPDEIVAKEASLAADQSQEYVINQGDLL